MTKTCLSFALLLLLAACASQPEPESAPEPPSFTGNIPSDLAEVDRLIAAGPFDDSWTSLESIGVPEWYLDDKFGIFIHWGVYAVPATGNEWYPRRMYQNQMDQQRGINIFEHHRKTWGPQKEFGYKDFIPMFKAGQFDAPEWAALFKASGARYVVPVAEHHDGFPMYDCSYTKWDASEMGPGRDVIAELAGAVRAEGMKFGVSSHRAFNYAYYPRSEEFDTVDEENFGLYGKPHEWLYGDMKGEWPPQTEEFKDDWLARTAELVESYQPDLVWFDFGIGPRWVESPEANPFQEHLRKFTAFYYNRAAALGKVGAINYKLNAMPEKAGILDIERGKLDDIRERYWQTDTSVSYNSWGYISNHDYKSVDTLVDDLADIVAKNGCLLLNIGPKPDGTIPDPEVAMLKEIGQWLSVNGEAIYGSRPWKTYGEGSAQTSGGHMSERKFRDVRHTAEDIRFTTKGDALYAIALAWPANGKLTVKSLAGAPVQSVSLLGHEGELAFAAGSDGLEITVPAEQPCEHAFAFKIMQ